MSKNRVFVAGHKGLVGSALVRELSRRSGDEIVMRTSSELDLRNQAAVRALFAEQRPRTVFLAAGKVGGIQANNTQRWEFIYDNLLIEANVLGCCLEFEVPRVVFFGSSCIYPREAEQPIREEYLLRGPLEPTNEPYAIAKIAGLKLVEAAATRGFAWLSVMPTNLYGPGDNFDLHNSHVLPALIRKFHDAAAGSGAHPDVRVWGTGSPMREFLHVDDVAVAACHLLDRGCTGLYNIGSGEEVSIRELAEMVAAVAGFRGRIQWDSSKPDGTPRKFLDSSKARATGWQPAIPLREGLTRTFQWYASHVATAQRY